MWQCSSVGEMSKRTMREPNWGRDLTLVKEWGEGSEGPEIELKAQGSFLASLTPLISVPGALALWGFEGRWA